MGSQLQLRELLKRWIATVHPSGTRSLPTISTTPSQPAGPGIPLERPLLWDSPGTKQQSQGEPRLAGLGTKRVLGWKEVTFRCAAGDTLIALPLTTITTTNSRNIVP